MSAWIVSDDHINALISFAVSREGDVSYEFNGQRHKVCNDAQKYGRVLHNENVRSVNYRYDDQTPLDTWIYSPFGRRVNDPVVIMKACDCLEYQSCETPEYYQSEAYALTKAIRHAASVNVPGYADAPWGID